MRSYGRSLTTDSRLGRCLRLALVLSVWQAPIPWVHAHSLEAGVGAAPGLARHLRDFHSGTVATHAVSPGWHLHFGLLGDLMGGEDDGPARRTPLASSAEFQPLVPADAGPVLTASGTVMPDALPAEPSVTSGRLPLAPPASYLTTWAGSSPLLVLLCVARR